mgnify:CR=1 FL=1
MRLNAGWRAIVCEHDLFYTAANLGAFIVGVVGVDDGYIFLPKRCLSKAAKFNCCHAYQPKKSTYISA